MRLKGGWNMCAGHCGGCGRVDLDVRARETRRHVDELQEPVKETGVAVRLGVADCSDWRKLGSEGTASPSPRKGRPPALIPVVVTQPRRFGPRHQRQLKLAHKWPVVPRQPGEGRCRRIADCSGSCVRCTEGIIQEAQCGSAERVKIGGRRRWCLSWGQNVRRRVQVHTALGSISRSVLVVLAPRCRA